MGWVRSGNVKVARLGWPGGGVKARLGLSAECSGWLLEGICDLLFGVCSWFDVCLNLCVVNRLLG